MTTTPHTVDPTLDLVLEREIDLAPEAVWQAWTTPEIARQWFAPKPWETTVFEVELRPGGAFRTTMRSPEGDEYPGAGCVLEVVPGEKLVWTTSLAPGFRPQPSDLPFTAILEFTPTSSGGTQYRAIGVHADEAGAKQHAEMGFVEGWGMCLDQLIDVVSTGQS